MKENGAIIGTIKLLEIEYELLKYTAMHHLGKKYHEHGGRKSCKTFLKCQQNLGFFIKCFDR